jgi:predicted GTPase
VKARFDCIVMGAAGRDFHDFLAFMRLRPQFHVRAFTAAQIPGIEARAFPRALAGPAYAADIAIHPESELPRLIAEHDIDFVFLAYSDLSHADVMQRASLVESCGASFVLLGPRHTQLRAPRPLVAVTAVRTGAGKSPLTQHLATALRDAGHRTAVIRHPMPYGDLARQVAQRFATAADLAAAHCTVEEREEYAPYVALGVPVHAGVDYAAIAGAAAADADVLLWDGGNNDFAFYTPDLDVTVADARRPEQVTGWHPGEVNFRRAQVIVISKVARAAPGAVQRIRDSARALNPAADIVEADLDVHVDATVPLAGQRALVIEDGPTMTHGGLHDGAGLLAALRAGAQPVDVRPFAVGSIAATLAQFPHIGPVLPALGYSAAQLDELARTIARTPCDVVVDASPAGVSTLLGVARPCVRVRYRFVQRSGTPLAARVIALAAGRTPANR